MKTFKYRNHEISIDNFSDWDGQNKYCVAIDDDVDVLQDDFDTESEGLEAARKMIDLIVEERMR